MIIIKEAVSKNEMRAFVKFPFSIYKENPYWVPPIIKDEIASFDKNVNPVFKHAEAKFFLAYKNNKVVGRIAAIINWTEVKEQKIKKMRFGWFDTIDDINVTDALLNKVKEIGKTNNLEFIEGPVGFSNLDKVGVLTEGYDSLGTMITWYNHAYYVNHLEKLGLKKAKGWLEHSMDFKNIIPHKFTRISKIIASRLELKLLEFTKSKDIMPYVDDMFDLLAKLNKDSLFVETVILANYFIDKTEENDLLQGLCYYKLNALDAQGKYLEAIAFVEPLTKKEGNQEFWKTALIELKDKLNN